MKTAGIVGGIGPESTIAYYRGIIAGYQARTGDGSYPHLFINSVNNKEMLALTAENPVRMTDRFVEELEALHRAGADFAVLAANTAHIVFDAVLARSPLPLISIVETARDAVLRRNLFRVGLFGTRFTMASAFFPAVFTPARITLITPTPDEQDYIHDKYLNELVRGVFLPETRERLLTIARRLRDDEGIEGLILGGTELPLLLTDAGDTNIPFFDTTQLHVEKIVARILGEER